MPSEKEVQKLVDHWVQYCIEYLESGRNEKRKSIKGSDKNEIYSHAGEKCPTCTETMAPQPNLGRKPRKGELPEKHGITAEHIVPRVIGGDNKRANLVSMCHHCNQCRNAVMMNILPSMNSIRGKALTDSVREILSRYIEWSLRTIHTPKSKKVDTELSEIFANYSSQLKSKITKKSAKVSKKKHLDESDEVLEVLKEILETQKAILERLQKSPLRRFRDWIFGFLPSKKTRPKVDARLKKHERKKSRRNRNRRRRISEKKEEMAPHGEKKSGPIHKYFCPTCNTLFTKWGKAKLHKKETGHGCRVCDDCGEFFAQEKLRLAHEDQTGHTNYSGQFFGQKRMSIKHYLPVERLAAIDTLEKNEIDVEEFSKIIEELIGEDEVTGVELGNRVRRYQKSNDWPTLGTRAFLGAFGIPKNRGLAKAIVTVMGDQVTVIGDDHITRKIRLNSKHTTPETEPEPELPQTPPKQAELKQDGDVFPLVDGLNTSKKGLRLPREPKQLAIVLMWFAENAHKYQSTSDLKTAMSSASIIGKTRGNWLLTKLYYIYLPKSNGGISTADWSSIKVFDSITLFDKLQTFVYQYLLDKQIEMTNHHSDYFVATRENLS